MRKFYMIEKKKTDPDFKKAAEKEGFSTLAGWIRWLITNRAKKVLK